MHDDPLTLARRIGCVANAQADPSDPSVYLAEMAARQALDMARLAPTGTPAILGVSKGAMHAWTAASLAYGSHLHRAHAYADSFGQPVARPLPTDASLSVALGPVGYLATHLTRRLALDSTPMGIVAACSSSLVALDTARRWLLDADMPNRPRRVLVLTSEAAILPAFIHSYLRLGVLPIVGGDPSVYQQKPLDETRSGFVLAEQGAAVLLERYSRQDQGSLPDHLAELLDSQVAAEAFDLIRPPYPPPPTSTPTCSHLPDAASAGSIKADSLADAPAAETALEYVAGQLMAGRSIDLLHPHATGTIENDRQEMAVYRKLWQRWQTPRPDVYACKGAMGHGLGSAGLTALVLAVLAGRCGRRPPMPWLTQPMACGFDLSGASRKVADESMQAIFAAGFGGHVAGAVIRCRRRVN